MVVEEHDFWFHSGHVALDMALTGGPQWRSRWERLHSPADLDAWLIASVLEIAKPVSVAADLEAARELREGLWVASNAVVDCTGIPTHALDVINHHARGNRLKRQLNPDGSCRWVDSAVPDALCTIADEAIRLLSGESSVDVRRCEGDRCYLLFVDSSPGRRRRWCSMERCGNRAKVRKHRAKPKP